MKKIISISLALLLSLASCQTTVFGGESTASAVTETGAASVSVITDSQELGEDELPSSFDLRENGVVTPVKTQNPWQSCWAFAGIAAAESSILSMMKEKGEEIAAKDFDLSEKHLAWFATQPITENIDPAQTGEGLYMLSDAPNAVYDTGGMSLFVTTLFSAGVGPIYEKYFPYQGSTGLSDREYLIQYPDETRKDVLNTIVIKLLSGVTLEEIVADPDSDDARAYLNYLCDKGYLNKEDPLTIEALEEASIQMYLNEYTNITSYSKFDDWTIPELGEDGNPNRNLTSGFTLVDGNILPNLYNKDAEGKWESVNWDGIQAVKEELLQGRAVSAGFKADVSAPGQPVPENAYMNYDNWAHYTYEDVPQSHAICIVGWDDEYPSGNFPEGHQPPADGAWLVKNSWGSEIDYLDLREDAQIGKGEFGMKDESGKHTGYFWISYYDKTLNNCETMSFDTVLTDEDGDLGVWMYDYMPSIVSADENTSVQSEDLIRTANVFKNDTGIDVNLYAVSTKTANPDANVKYFIYQLNENAATPEDGTLLAAGEGSYPYAGFHRVMLDSPIPVRDGETIAIVAEESVIEDGKTLYEYGVNVAKTAKNAEETGEPMYGVAVVNEGESFIFENGAWADWSMDERREALKEQYAIDNFSIKAYMIADHDVQETQWLYEMNRASIANMSIEESPVYVIGHRSPDSDTVCSAIAYARMLTMLGYPAEAAITEPVNRETEYILKTAGAEAPPVMDDAAGKSIFLIDHSEYAQALEGMEDAHIVGVIDHHGIGNVTTGHQVVYEAKPIGAAATIIFLDYLNYGLEIDKTTATLLLGAILSDTANLTTSSVTETDRQAVPKLAEIAEITDVNDFYWNLHSEALSYTGMSNEEILFSDYKEYEASGVKFGIGLIQAIDEDHAKAMAERMKEALPDSFKSKQVDLLYADIGIREGDVKVDYIVPCDGQSRDVFEAAFPNCDEYDGTSYIFRNGGLGRKSKLVPGLTEYLNAHPHE